MTAEEKLNQLQQILRPVIAWYERVLADGEPDPSYLYDTTSETFERLLSRGDYQAVVELLRGGAS